MPEWTPVPAGPATLAMLVQDIAEQNGCRYRGTGMPADVQDGDVWAVLRSTGMDVTGELYAVGSAIDAVHDAMVFNASALARYVETSVLGRPNLRTAVWPLVTVFGNWGKP